MMNSAKSTNQDIHLNNTVTIETFHSRNLDDNNESAKKKNFQLITGHRIYATCKRKQNFSCICMHLLTLDSIVKVLDWTRVCEKYTCAQLQQLYSLVRIIITRLIQAFAEAESK